MTRKLLPLLLFLILALQGCVSPRPSHPADILITNAVLISPEREKPLQGAWLAINGDRIVAVGDGAPPAGASEIIDAQGKYLIPGLIDSHVHLYHATGLKRRYTDDFDRLYAAYMAQQPRSFLYYGFTSIIELNSDEEANARFLSSPQRPRLFHCGQGVILSDGFMAMELGATSVGEAYPGYLIDTYRDAPAPPGADPAAHTPEAAVRHIKDSGGRCVKAYYEEALWWPGDEPPAFSLPTPEIMRDLVGEAHHQDMPVILHATTPAGHEFALATGVDILAHGMWEWPGQAFDAPEPQETYADIASRIAASETWLQPTFASIRNTASLFNEAVLADPRWVNAVPSSYMDYLKGDAQKQRDMFLAVFEHKLRENGETAPVPALQRAFNLRYQRLIGKMAENGANLTFGTDTAVGAFGWASPPGLAGLWEIGIWDAAGIDPETIFKALTINNASAFGLSDDLGTLEAAKLADLLLLRENPLEDVSAYDTIELVITGGSVIDRQSLSAAQN